MCKWSVKQFTSNHPLITVRIKVYEIKMVYRDVRVIKLDFRHRLMIGNVYDKWVGMTF